MQRATYDRVGCAHGSCEADIRLAGAEARPGDEHHSIDQTGGVVELDFDKSISDGVNIYAKRDGDADFVFLARDTASPYIDNRLLLVATKPELCEYKAVYVLSDAEIGLFSDEVVVNCAP